MTTWILTIGNSDIQLKTEDTWLTLSELVYEEIYNHVFVPNKVENEDLWTVPARAVGLAYSKDLETYYDDLHFPLLDSFTELLQQQNIIPDKIIILLSDQSNLFDEMSRYSIKCPYWKDTCTVEPIINKYLEEKFPNTKLKYLTLTPLNNSKGLDSWDKTLDLVTEKLANLSISEREKIYVSHQAGTPALSSALQFISLSQFGERVKFLVSSEYEEDATEILDSSRYLRGLKIQQSKSLITNSPGAALKLLNNIDDIKSETIDKLKYFVDFFNLNRLKNDDDEFSIESATQRIVDVLDLIGIFFSQQNYLEGIGLLSASHETFMKVAILKKISDITINVNGKSKLGSECFVWDNQGLHLSKSFRSNINQQNKILEQLNYPSDYKIEHDKDWNKTNKNWVMLDWLKLLEPRFKPWSLLQWSCLYYRNSEVDLRNQLMHNLRGVEKIEVINYLLGYPKNPPSYIDEQTEVIEVYNEEVKKSFFNSINLFQLPFNREKLIKELNKLASCIG